MSREAQSPGVYDTGRLRELAQAATPGPWVLSEPQGNWIWPHICNTYGSRREDAAYIAAVSPDVLLALLTRLAAIETLCEELMEFERGTMQHVIGSRLDLLLSGGEANHAQ